MSQDDLSSLTKAVKIWHFIYLQLKTLNWNICIGPKWKFLLIWRLMFSAIRWRIYEHISAISQIELENMGISAKIQCHALDTILPVPSRDILLVQNFNLLWKPNATAACLFIWQWGSGVIQQFFFIPAPTLQFHFFLSTNLWFVFPTNERYIACQCGYFTFPVIALLM